MATNDTVVKEIFIECRPETLFSFFTDPGKMVRWMGRHVLLEPTIGGRFRIDFNGTDVALGNYVELVPHTGRYADRCGAWRALRDGAGPRDERVGRRASGLSERMAGACSGGESIRSGNKPFAAR